MHPAHVYYTCMPLHPFALEDSLSLMHAHPPPQDLSLDPTLESHKRALVVDAAQQLKASQMTVFDEKSGNLFVTELGRVASHYYIRYGRLVLKF